MFVIDDSIAHPEYASGELDEFSRGEVDEGWANPNEEGEYDGGCN